MQIILDTRGMLMSVRNHCFLFASGERSNIVHPSRISSIVATAPCRITTPAILLAAENQIPLIVCNTRGQPQARLWSSNFINTSALRRRQHLFTLSKEGLMWADAIISQKINGQADNLDYIATFNSHSVKTTDRGMSKGKDSPLEIAVSITETDGMDSIKKKILFREAYAAARYWQRLGESLTAPFAFTNRSKRHPSDPFNACINYLYGMLRHEVETAVLSIGLDPALGVIHRDGYRMASLVFDVMEPFRPYMDRILWTAAVLGQFPADGFQLEQNAPCLITKPGRKFLIELFTTTLHGKIAYKQSRNSLRNHILTEIKKLSLLIKAV